MNSIWKRVFLYIVILIILLALYLIFTPQSLKISSDNSSNLSNLPSQNNPENTPNFKGPIGPPSVKGPTEPPPGSNY